MGDKCPYSPTTACKKNKPCKPCAVFIKWEEYKEKCANGTQKQFEPVDTKTTRKQGKKRKKKKHKPCMVFRGSYKEYIKSEVWRRKRQSTFSRDKGKCVVCGDKAENVHHWFYTLPYGTERLHQLGSVCGRCHDLIHTEYADSINALKKMRHQKQKKAIEELKFTLLGHIAQEQYEGREE